MTDFAELKEKAKKTWSDFASMENFTSVAAPKLVRFAGVSSDSRVLDVACGTGVVALTAARSGAKVTGTDLTPDLIARAKENNKDLPEAYMTAYERGVELIKHSFSNTDIQVFPKKVHTKHNAIIQPLTTAFTGPSLSVGILNTPHLFSHFGPRRALAY